MRPFILRRTKIRWRASCPRRTEQTLYCELEPPQRALRRVARALPRDAVGRSSGTGIGRRACRSSRRCCACVRRRAIRAHRRDKRRATSAKLEVLRAQTARAGRGGHKAWSSRSSRRCPAAASTARQAGSDVRVSRRPDARSRPRGAAISAGSRLPALPHQPEGRRASA